MFTRGLPDPLQSETVGAGESTSFILRRNAFIFSINAKDTGAELRWKYGNSIGLDSDSGAYRTIPAGQNGGVSGMWIDRDTEIHVYNASLISTIVDFQASYGIGDGDTRGMPEEIELLAIPANSTNSFDLRRNSISFILFTRGSLSQMLQFKFGEFESGENGIQIQQGYEDGMNGLWIDRDTEVHIKNPNSSSALVEVEKHIGIG